MKAWLIDFIVNKILLKNYLSKLIDRLDGYKWFLSTSLTILLGASYNAGGNNDILNVIITQLMNGNVEALLNPEEIAIITTSIMSVYSLIMKVVKKFKGQPQVPEMVKTGAPQK
jgi:hypothetical protein